jgi:8-hydroxy-5-deazaflavin:NADPH oxidoreductase
MKVTVIGSGNMASAFVKQLSIAGHKVRVTGRNIDKVKTLASQFPGVESVDPAAAARDADAIIVATPFEAAADALHSLGDLKGKTVVDITNPLTPDYMGLTIGHGTSAAEQIAAAVPGADIVKGFNTLFAQVLADGANFGEGRKATVFVAGDSEQAKQTTKALAESMGFETLDAGPLKNARYLEPVAGLNIYFGYGAGMGTTVAPTWLRKSV